HLVHGSLLVRVLGVVAGSLERLRRRVGERQVAGHAGPPRLVLGRRDVLEELRDALVLLGLGALHHPKRGAADDRVSLRIAGQAWEEPGAPGELAFEGAGQVADAGGPGRDDAAL